jgi:hypothetical protein
MLARVPSYLPWSLCWSQWAGAWLRLVTADYLPISILLLLYSRLLLQALIITPSLMRDTTNLTREDLMLMRIAEEFF